MFSTIIGTFLVGHFLASLDATPLHSFLVLLGILAFHQVLFRWLESPFSWRFQIWRLWKKRSQKKSDFADQTGISYEDVILPAHDQNRPALNPTFSQLDFQSIKIRDFLEKRVSIRDAESCDWLNYFFQGMWRSSLESQLWSGVETSIYQFLKKHKPDFVDSIEIKIHPGRHPPTFIDMRNIYSSEKEMEFESKCQFVGDAKIDVIANFRVPFTTARLISIPVTATDCTFLGQVWAGIRYGEDFPFIDQVSLAFQSRPRITVKVNTLAQLNVFQVPLVSEWLKMMITEKAIDALVYPKSFTINVRSILANGPQTQKKNASIMTDF